MNRVLGRCLTAPSSPAEVEIGQVVVLEANPHKRIEICQTTQIRDPIVVRFELAEVSQARKVANRLELVVTDVEPLEIRQVLERSQVGQAVRGGEQRAQSRRYARQVSDLVVVPVKRDDRMSVSLNLGANEAQEGPDPQVDLVEIGQELLETDDAFGLFTAQINRPQIFPVWLEGLDVGDVLEQTVV